MLKIYCFLFFLMAALVFVFPVPTNLINVYTKSALVKLAKSDANTVIFGSSTVYTVSPCDADKRSIPDMLADESGAPVLDASYGGARLEESVNWAALAAKKPNIKMEIVSFALQDLIDHNIFSLHDYSILHLLNHELDVDSPTSYFGGFANLQGTPGMEFNSFSYRGEAYGGLANYNANIFPKERMAETCPPKDGQDMRGVEALYFHKMIEYTPNMDNVPLLVSLNSYVNSLNKSVIFVLSPINFELVGRFDASWPGIIRERRDAFLAKMKSRGVPVLDLSEGLPNTAFMQRWCGCSHLAEAGRTFVATKIYEAFLALPRATNTNNEAWTARRSASGAR